MYYHSTRGSDSKKTFEQVVFEGLSPDGGLYIPSSFPYFSLEEISTWADLRFEQVAFKIFRFFIPLEEISDADLKRLLNNSYSTFTHPKVAPVVDLGDGLKILELFHGPTFAFKDIALQFLGNIFEFFLQKRNISTTKTILNVVGATSGDTGGAAIYGLKGKKNVNVFILHPKDRISPIQYAQMTSVLDENVHNVAVEGTFDDCQEIVKKLFSNLEFKRKYNLGAVNSINWARIMAQTVYYFTSFLQVQPRDPKLWKPVQFVVPTGNFGDVLAGFYAKQMGLPVAKLAVATNENDILHRFFSSGTYKKDALNAKFTQSPAMDILVSSNFERLLWHLSNSTGGNASERVSEWMTQLAKTGEFTVDQAVLALAKTTFVSHRVTDEQTLDCISRIHKKYSYIIDPHTAVGICCAEELGDSICLSTASPGKFPDAVTSSLCNIEFKDFCPKQLFVLQEMPQKCEFVATGGKLEQGLLRIEELIKSFN